MNLLMIMGDGISALKTKGALYNTLSELHKYFDRIDIICTKVKGLDNKYFDNVYAHPSPWPKVFQPFWILKKGKEIYNTAPFKVFTVHDYPPFYNGLGVRWLYKKIRVPCLSEIMHIPGYPRSADLKESFYRLMMKIFVRYMTSPARKVRVINQKEAPGFLSNSGIKKEKLVYIPAFYIDIDIFKSADVPKEFDCVYAARLEKNKGLHLLVKAIQILKKTRPRVKLLIVGQGPEKKRIERLSESMGLRDNIIFSGWLKDQLKVAEAYNRSKIFVNAALNEGGPRVALEAMACGLPIISTPVGIMQDVIKDGMNGFLVSWEPEAIAKKINILLNREDLYIQFSKLGQEAVVSNFEKRKSIEFYAKALMSLNSTAQS